MNQQARMLKTLACLAVAMIGTSALLGWMDPSGPLPEGHLSPEVLHSMTQSLVSDGLAIRKGQWGHVEIGPDPAGSTTGSFLAATADPDDCHFRIDLDGWPSRTNRWTRQEAMSAHPLRVSIEVACTEDCQTISRAQWRSVRALASVLGVVISSSQSSLPVFVNGEWAQTLGVNPDTPLTVPSLDSSEF